MVALNLTSEDLLAGADITYKVKIPPEILHPGKSTTENKTDLQVHLRPLTIGTFQLVLKASRDDNSLIPILMIKESLVEPQMTFGQVKKLHLGLIKFLIGHIRQISGLNEKKN